MQTKFRLNVNLKHGRTFKKYIKNVIPYRLAIFATLRITAATGSTGLIKIN